MIYRRRFCLAYEEGQMFGAEIFKGNLNDAKETLSFSAFQSVVRHAFGSCEPADRKADMMGIDARCLFQAEVDGVRTRVSFDVQLKGTSQARKTLLNQIVLPIARGEFGG